MRMNKEIETIIIKEVTPENPARKTRELFYINKYGNKVFGGVDQ
jgi:hypothetical protein